MIRQRYKDYVYDVIGLLALPNHYRLRYLPPLRHRKDIKLHLACGAHYIDGWLNVDGNPLLKKDMWLDVRNGLPFATNSAAIIFSSHFLEHLDIESLTRVLRECHRVLNDRNGIMRMVVPSFEKALQAYLRHDREWFNIPGRGLSTRFVNWVLCWCQHRLFFDFDYLRECLEDQGFVDIRRAEYGQSHGLSPEELLPIDRATAAPEKSMFLECRKG